MNNKKKGLLYTRASNTQKDDLVNQINYLKGKVQGYGLIISDVDLG